MKHCVNEGCGHFVRFNRHSEFQDEAGVCSDCGEALVPGEAPRGVRQGSPNNPGPWRRLLVTGGALAVAHALQLVPVPGLSEMSEESSRTGFADDAGLFSIVSLSLTSIIGAFVIVELAALLVPRWRRLRIGAPEGRRRLDAAALRLGLFLTVLQAFVLAWSFNTIVTDSGIPLVEHPGLEFLVIATLSMVGGTLLLIALIALINRFGLGSGVSVLLGFQLLASVGSSVSRHLFQSSGGFANGDVTPLDLLPLAIVAVAVAGAFVFLLRGSSKTRVEVAGLAFSPPLPGAGLLPISEASAIVLLLAQVQSLFHVDVRWLADWLSEPMPQAVLVTALAALLTLLFNWPRSMLTVLARRLPSEEPAASHSLLVARQRVMAALVNMTLMTVLFLLGSFLAGPFFVHVAKLPFLFNVVPLLVVTAVGFDLVSEWRARRAEPGLCSIWQLHRPWEAQIAIAALAQAKIPAHARGLAHRTIWQLFGPILPITVMVPAERAEAAQTVLRALLVGDAPITRTTPYRD